MVFHFGPKYIFSREIHFQILLSRYVDVILNLIRLAGDYVSEEVWYRVIQIVINREDVQGYAAKTVFEALQAHACHENMVKVGGYILGKYFIQKKKK